MAWKFFTSSGTEKVTTLGSGGGYGTSLPASPTDGQEFTLVDSATAPTYQWRFRYNANSVNTDKWEFVGGLPRRVDGSGATVTNVAFTDPSAVVSFTAPRAGQYDIEIAANLYDAAGAVVSNAALKRGTAATVDADGVNTPVNNVVKTGKRILRVTAAAGDVFKIQAKVSSGTVTLTTHAMVVTPVRVS